MGKYAEIIRKSSDAAHVRKTESITIYIDGSNLSCTTFPFSCLVSNNSKNIVANAVVSRLRVQR